MPRRKSQPKFRFWPGGPRAYKGDEYWVGKSREWDGGYCYLSGCFVVHNGGFEIPEDTYRCADSRVSQLPYFTLSEFGYNRTALLPIEVDE